MPRSTVATILRARRQLPEVIRVMRDAAQFARFTHEALEKAAGFFDRATGEGETPTTFRRDPATGVYRAEERPR